MFLVDLYLGWAVCADCNFLVVGYFTKKWASLLELMTKCGLSSAWQPTVSTLTGSIRKSCEHHKLAIIATWLIHTDKSVLNSGTWFIVYVSMLSYIIMTGIEHVRTDNKCDIISNTVIVMIPVTIWQWMSKAATC